MASERRLRRIAGRRNGRKPAKAMKNRVRANLLYLVKERGLVAKEGERDTARWRLAEGES